MFELLREAKALEEISKFEGLVKRWPLLLCDGLQTMVEGATSGPTVRAYRYSPIPRW